LVLAGCAAVPWPRTPFVTGPEAGGPGALLDLRGVVHVHTRGSHDSPGTLEQVVRAARSAGVAWVAVTEHTQPGRLPPRGSVQGVAILPGYEFHARGGSILAIDVSGPPPSTGRDHAALVHWIHAQGGLAFVGHFESSRLADPVTYRELGLDGIELANLHAAAAARTVPVVLGALALPNAWGQRALAQTPIENMARWARLPEARTIVAGVDAHSRWRLLGPLGGTFDRYGDVFRVLTTHVLAGGPGPDAVMEALRAGRTYVAWEALGRVDAFGFVAGAQGFRVAAPRPARLALVCDGEEVDSHSGRAALLRPPPTAEWCRAEAWLDDRLWIATSRAPYPGSRVPGGPVR
jgi:hypothetical protein